MGAQGGGEVRRAEVVDRWGREIVGIVPGRILDVVTYREDLLVVVLGMETANETWIGLRRIIQEEVGLEMRTKREANKPFGCGLWSIGAEDGVLDLLQPIVNPTESFNSKVREMSDELCNWKGRAVQEKMVQRSVGPLKFGTAFQKEETFRCNS